MATSIKQQVLEVIQKLPDSVTLDDIVEELYFNRKVEAGLKELDEGQGIGHEEVEQRLSGWLKR